MLEDWTVALEATALAIGLRGSTWAYPLVNAGHILGVALLVGGIVPLDLRLIGIWPSTALLPLWRVLTRMAGVGLTLTVICGILLFITRATDYIHSRLFITKMIFVGIGITNAIVLLRAIPDERLIYKLSSDKIPEWFRIAAFVSLGTWLTALILGRLIGYF